MAISYDIVINQDEKQWNKPLFIPVGTNRIKINQMTHAQGYSLSSPDLVSGDLVDNDYIRRYGASAGIYIINVRPGLNEYSFKFNGLSGYYKTIRTFSFKVYGIPNIKEG